MATKINVPALGESVVEATVLQWHKNVNDPVNVDDVLVELETDKVTVEVPSPVAGILTKQGVEQGGDVAVGDFIAEVGDASSAAVVTAKKEPDASSSSEQKAQHNTDDAPVAENQGSDQGSEDSDAGESDAGESDAGENSSGEVASPASSGKPQPVMAALKASPAVRVVAETNNVNIADVTPSGPKGNVTKSDIIKHLQKVPSPRGGAIVSEGEGDAVQKTSAIKSSEPASTAVASAEPDPRGEQVVKMSRLRRSVAKRLKDAQNNAAILTTFNEVNLSRVMEMRAQYRDQFQKIHGDARLGMMSFFVLAAVQALKEFPNVNAEIRGDDIVYKNYYDIGVALASPQGLVVPVLRDADQMSMAGVERSISQYGEKAKQAKLSIGDLTGGTFTITNGGVFGSLLSTPILNPPQSAILGMHGIQKRPIVDTDGEIKAASMMYVALSYDHRIIDGKDAVLFLVRIKNMVEDPSRLLLQV